MTEEEEIRFWFEYWDDSLTDLSAKGSPISREILLREDHGGAGHGAGVFFDLWWKERAPELGFEGPT